MSCASWAVPRSHVCLHCHKLRGWRRLASGNLNLKGGKGLCSACYSRWYRAGAPVTLAGAPARPRPRTRPAHARWMIERAHRARLLADQGMTGQQVGWAMNVHKRTAVRYIRLGRELEAQRQARRAAEIRSNHLIGQQVHRPMNFLTLTGV